MNILNLNATSLSPGDNVQGLAVRGRGLGLSLAPREGSTPLLPVREGISLHSTEKGLCVQEQVEHH